MTHPIHLHGHNFWVLGSMANATFPVNKTVAEAKTQGVALSIQNPVLRDTAQLGWLVPRFVDDNPGVWLMHLPYQRASLCELPFSLLKTFY